MALLDRGRGAARRELVGPPPGGLRQTRPALRLDLPLGRVKSRMRDALSRLADVLRPSDPVVD